MRSRLIVFLVLLTLLSPGMALADCIAETCASYGRSADEIAAYTPPQFRQLHVDDKLLHDRNYWRVEGDLSIYDAPHGSVVRTLDAGFNFVTTRTIQDGWAEINPGEWIPTDNLKNTNWVVSRFTGIFLPDEPLQYPAAWMLINAHPSNVPGGPALESNDLLYRYTRVTIFDAVEVDGWRWYQIGPDQWVQQTGVAKVIPVERPPDVDTERWLSIDLYEQVLIAYEGEQPVFATLIASGLPRWPTYEGTFNIYYRRTREKMSWGTPGDDFYYLQEVPWTMYFDEGRAVHGAYWHDGFGYRRSHGCVNMSITDAHWLYRWVAEEFDALNSPDVETGPAVYVYSSGEYR
jgi:hypothetical protein